MNTDLFAALLESAEEALAHSKGKQKLRTTVLPGAPKVMGSDEVRALRETINASQSVFAHYLNVSTKLVQAWEANRRRPDGAALRLLELAAQQPAFVFAGLVTEPAPIRAGAAKATRTLAAKSRSREQKSTPKVTKSARRSLASA